MAYPDRKQVLAVDAGQGLEVSPLILPLEVAFGANTHYSDKENALALQGLKDEIKKRVNSKKINGSQIGTLAAGFVTGRLNRVETSVPVGLYRLADNGDAIVFERPDLLRETWGDYEIGVGPTFQNAMSSILASLSSPVSPEVTTS